MTGGGHPLAGLKLFAASEGESSLPWGRTNPSVYGRLRGGIRGDRAPRGFNRSNSRFLLFKYSLSLSAGTLRFSSDLNTTKKFLDIVTFPIRTSLRSPSSTSERVAKRETIEKPIFPMTAIFTASVFPRTITVFNCFPFK